MLVDTPEGSDPFRTLQVETLVPPPMRAVIESAVAALSALRSGERPPPDAIAFSLRHQSRIESLLADFAYASHCVLIAHVEFAIAQRSGSSPNEVLRDLISSWDATLLLYEEDASAPILDAVSCTNLAPRIAFGAISAAGVAPSTLWTLQLGRLISNEGVLPRPPQARIPSHTWQQLQRLPANWQRVVRCALVKPDAWDSDRIAHECCTTRRTLERRMRRAGLPSPSALLRMAR